MPTPVVARINFPTPLVAIKLSSFPTTIRKHTDTNRFFSTFLARPSGFRLCSPSDDKTLPHIASSPPSRKRGIDYVQGVLSWHLLCPASLDSASPTEKFQPHFYTQQETEYTQCLISLRRLVLRRPRRPRCHLAGQLAGTPSTRNGKH